MDVEFTLTLEDLLAFNRYYLAQSPTIRRCYRRQTVYQAVSVAIACLVVSVLLPPPWWLWGAFVALCVVIFSVLAYAHPNSTRRTNTRLIARMYQEGENASLFRRQRLTIATETITNATDISVTTYKWPAIEKIVVDRQHAYFFVSAMSVFILPKWAFATDKSFQQYVEMAQRYHREAAGVVGRLPEATV